MMEMRETEKSNGAEERAHLLENLRSSENRELEEIARCAMEDPNTEIDRFYPYPLNKTLLDVACCEGREDVAERLLKLGADPNRTNETYNRAPLHFAAEAGHRRVLEVLLDDPRTRVNLRVAEQTALHIAVRRDRRECVEILLEKGRADPNVVNSKGVTPFHAAATVGNRELIGVMLRASRVTLDLDGRRDFQGRTSRDVVVDKMPDIAAQLPPVTLNVASDDPATTFSKETKEELDVADDAIGEALKLAAKRNLPERAAELAKKGLAVFASEDFGEAAAVVAVELAHRRVLREILDVLPGLANRLLLPACRELGVPTWPKREDGADERLECLRLIMEKPDVRVRCEDDKGNTPLHYAARAESVEAVRMFLNAGSYIGHRNVLGVPPLAHLSPSVLSDFFDDCLHSENERTDEYEIEFDYRSLLPFSTPGHSETETLAFVAESRALKSLLKHPLLSSYLYLKWHRTRHLLYANFALYAVFYVLINLHVTSSGRRTSPSNDTATTGDLTLPTRYPESFPPLVSLTAVALVLLAIREVLQFASSPWRYVTSFENVLEVGLVVLSGWVIVASSPRIGAVVVLLSAWELVVLIGQHPRVSTGVEMFKTVSLNFARFLSLYAFLILAFALAFFTLFRDSVDDENFPDPGHSLFKTIIMLTGEFDANDIPFVSHPVLSRAIFLLFVFLIAIVLFNLLNGLAVSDTADILNRSELVGLVSRARLVSYVESVAAGLSGSAGSNVRSVRRALLAPLARRVSLVPVYLPQAKIAVRPYKSNEIRLRGRADRAKGCRRFSMDPRIVERARNILSRRGVMTENQKMMLEFTAIKRKLEALEDSVGDVRRGLARNGVDLSTRRE